MPRKIDQRIRRARKFRQNPTDAERMLWQRLRQFPSGDVHFRRQATIGPYFADFACHTSKLVVEVDGGQHASSSSDDIRTAFLIDNGYRVLRFWNNDVLSNIDGVMESIVVALEAPPTPDPSPPREERVGGGESLVAALSLPSPPQAGGGEHAPHVMSISPPPSGGEGSGVGGASHSIISDERSDGGR